MTGTALALVASVPWAITPEMLRTVATIAARQGPGPLAVEAQLGRPLANSQTVKIRDGVAIVPIVGPIFRHANAFSAVSGATSVEILARDFGAALDDATVRAIVLNVDSPGGEVTGVHELAAMIHSARGRKPIVAYIGGQGASAAYWIASAADEIVVDATAQVGSIGVVQMVPNPAADASKPIEIVSSRAPNKRPDVTTKEGRATILATVDALAAIFVADVARNRKVTAAKVESDFGQGGVLVGAAAVAAGMVDALGSLEGVVARLKASPALPIGPAASRVGAVRALPGRPAAAPAAPAARPAHAPVRAALTDGERARCARFGWSEAEYLKEKSGDREQLIAAAVAAGHNDTVASAGLRLTDDDLKALLELTPSEGRIARLTGLSPAAFLAAKNRGAAPSAA